MLNGFTYLHKNKIFLLFLFCAGDLFEKVEDIEDPSIWLNAGSENPDLQYKNRLKIAEIADWIIPGHGKKFEVNNSIRELIKKQLQQSVNEFEGDVK